MTSDYREVGNDPSKILCLTCTEAHGKEIFVEYKARSRHLGYSTHQDNERTLASRRQAASTATAHRTLVLSASGSRMTSIHAHLGHEADHDGERQAADVSFDFVCDESLQSHMISNESSSALSFEPFPTPHHLTLAALSESNSMYPSITANPDE